MESPFRVHAAVQYSSSLFYCFVFINYRACIVGLYFFSGVSNAEEGGKEGGAKITVEGVGQVSKSI